MGRIAKAAMAREQRDSTDGEQNGDDVQRTYVIHDLELRHQKNEHETEIVVKDEDARRLRVRILLLRDENMALRDEMDLNNNTNTTLASQCNNLTAQIEASMATVSSQEEQLRKQEREFTSLKAELQAINEASENSANVLSEKLALARELANLKPEIEHLRSQVNHQQTTLAEKLSLERQVDTLEVELANEKKASRRAMQNRESNDRVEDELRKKLRETEKSLSSEKDKRERLEDQLEQKIKAHTIALQDQDSTRGVETDLRKKLQEAQRQLREEAEGKERLEEELQVLQRASKKTHQNKGSEQAEVELRAQLDESEKKLASLREETERREQEHQTAITEVTERNELLERRLEKAKVKFRGLQEELKQSQAELRKAQQQQTKSSGLEDNTNPTAKMQAFRRRKAQEAATNDFTNIEIQTPSADDAVRARRAMKKAVFEPTIVGEKSAFSITPFLNRSKNTNMSDEVEAADDEAVEDSILGPQAGSASRSARTQLAEPSRVADSPEAGVTTTVLQETENPQVALKPRGRPKKVLGDAPSAMKNVLPQKALKKKFKPKSNLEKVSEDPEVAETAELKQQDDNIEAEEAEPVEKTTTVKFNVDAPSEEEDEPKSNAEIPKKKKRKVLGSTKTLFDEDDGEAPTTTTKKPAKAQLGAKRTKAPLGGQRNAFAGAATFSPLKRDRRGVGASFLA